jgi:hypothetical protein
MAVEWGRRHPSEFSELLRKNKDNRRRHTTSDITSLLRAGAFDKKRSRPREAVHQMFEKRRRINEK